MITKLKNFKLYHHEVCSDWKRQTLQGYVQSRCEDAITRCSVWKPTRGHCFRSFRWVSAVKPWTFLFCITQKDKIYVFLYVFFVCFYVFYILRYSWCITPNEASITQTLNISGDIKSHCAATSVNFDSKFWFSLSLLNNTFSFSHVLVIWNLLVLV